MTADRPDGAEQAGGAGEGSGSGPGPRRRRPIREERSRGRKLADQLRVPAWVVVPLATGAGAFASGWPGAAFGFVAGLLLWWSRR